MRFNEKAQNPRKTVNYEEAIAYKLTPELELYTAVCCASLQPKFYEPNVSAQLEQIRKLITKVDADFVKKLAIYTREQMYLRSIPLVLAVELARIGKLDKKTVFRIIQRADEITEILAYYQMANERAETKKLNKLSKAIQKGIKEVFESGKFDEYQYAKYNRDTEIKLRDALFLTHPKPKDKEQEILFKKIAENTLEIPYTWEVELSRLGQQKFESEKDKKKAFKEKWEELIDSGRLGYMAMLRNLRNFLEYGISDKHIDKVCQRISNPDEVKKSKQLPFRFFSAYRRLTEANISHFRLQDILDALENAIIASVENVKGFDLDTKVLIACDVSRSMMTAISKNSAVQYYDIGLLLGQLLQYKCRRIITGFFGSVWEPVILPKNNILQNTLTLRNREGVVGYSTNGYKVLEWMIERRINADKIMFFTDCQLWDSDRYSYGHSSQMSELWNKYRKEINPDAKLYLFDLAGYGTTPLDVITEKNVFLIAGWSDKIFDVLDNIERGKSVIEIIRNYN